MKSIENSKLKNKFIFYPWLMNSELDFLIDSRYLETANGLSGFGIVKCNEEFEDYILIEVLNSKLLVLKSGIAKILSTPKFDIGDNVEFSKDGKQGLISHRNWHTKREKYFYNINGKSKRVFENEITPYNNTG